MLRVTTLYASSAAASAQYYTRYLTGATGEEPGQWTGRQAAALGLAGEVSTGQLQALLEGRDPVSGELLGRPLVDRVTRAGVVTRAVAGFDATLSAPKSLSIWWALSGDDGLAQCHDVAVRAVVDCVERYGSTTRIRHDGRRLHPDTGGLTVAVFRQTTSRLDDPQLHSHVVISSKVQTDDDRWMALDARTLKGFQRSLGGLYQSVLRAELTARYGVAFDPIVNGQAEIAGVSTDLVEQFSKRTAQVDAAFQSALADFWDREGRDPSPKERGALGRQAALDTRTHKTGTDPAELSERWRAEAADIGVTADLLTESIRDHADRQPTPASVTVGDVLGALVEERSAWHRFDVLRAVCDQTRPVAGVDGQAWARSIGSTVDQVLGACVDLDPRTDTVRRRSDARSVWIEPSARHHTSREILAQEEHLLSWAIGRQADPPTPGAVKGSGLDVLQREAAAAVAGRDGLVLIVGPAGTGKTTMLAAAVTNLGAQGRPVFGLAPTAKAARVLAAETGMPVDTVAKLLHEWTRPDRGPDEWWRLPAGCTVIVDEAGMAATGDLYRLTRLADVNHWRLVLVGDPHQLQAVGRGGMFTELCATGRTIELTTVRRFTHQWEAAATLQLRQGNPYALEHYRAHERIHAGPLAEHLDTIAATWLDHHAAGTRLAITATSNEHVTTINRHVQTARRDAGQLGDRVEIGAGEFAVGDVITTRANRRDLLTDTGDMVRNRDYWTINHTNPNGDLNVTRLDGHGTITLPAGYVADHVQLGYAATEPGNQSDTTDASITLATSATTCRGLYVGMTRGRDSNDVHVVTDTHHPQAADDVLHQILATDRADLPATRIRRELATQSPPAPVLHARCQIPAWITDLEHDARQDGTDARRRIDQLDNSTTNSQSRIEDIQRRLAALAPMCEPHDRAIADLREAVKDAERTEARARIDKIRAPRFHRHSANKRHQAAVVDHAARRTELDAATAAGAAPLGQRQQLTDERKALGRTLYSNSSATQVEHGRIEQAGSDLAALHTWRQWAQGNRIHPDTLTTTADHLHQRGGPHAALAQPLHTWLHQHGITPPTRPEVEQATPSRSIGIEL